MTRVACGILGAVLLLALGPAGEARQGRRITILYDAFGPRSALEKDWGFAALVEYGGRPR